MSRLVEKTHALLGSMYDADRALFSSISHLEKDGRVINDFSTDASLRYTVNSLAGLQRARSQAGLNWDVEGTLNRFLEKHGKKLTDPADKGLLLDVLVEEKHPRQHELFKEIQTMIADPRRWPVRFHLQQASWILTGLVKYAATTQSGEAIREAERFFQLVDKHFLNKDTMLPFYRIASGRRSFCAFGGIVYFLKALGEYSAAFNNGYADVLFREGVSRIIEFQGPQGEWPWFYNVISGKVADRYPVYSVHQDSMSMLFLLPAHDRGLGGAKDAIEKSYRWMFGENELKEPMIVDDPFFIYRSIRRDEALERPRRFLRGLLSNLIKEGGEKAAPSALAILKEGRSYHPGWILYAWSGRTDFSEFTSLGRIGVRELSASR